MTLLVLLFGGRSAEHEVSCVTAAHVLAAADPERYDVVAVGITRDGAWVRATAAADALVAEGPPVDLEALLTPGSVVFPLLHGPFGEDGTVQGRLELAGVPYVGTGVLGSAVCMDKAVAKEVLARAGIAQVRHRALRDVEVDAAALDRVVEDLGLPVFVKPANLGSSVAVTKAHDRDELDGAARLALSYDEWLVVEEAVTAREIECGLLGYPELRASLPGEVRPSHEFYDYEDKYVAGAADVVVPASLPPGVVEQVQAMAVAAGRALRVDGMARVDFFYEEAGRGLLVNEVNTIPGFTPISMYPKMWAASGLSYPELIDRLVDAAVARNRHRRPRYGRSR